MTNLSRFTLTSAVPFLLLLNSCGVVAQHQLRSESGKKAFMESCVSEASKSGGQIDAEKIKNYCQCSLDGLNSDRVSEKDLDAFIKSQSGSGEVPEVITQLFTDCVKKALS